MPAIRLNLMVIELQNLNYSYSKNTLALSNITTKLSAGVHLLLGANGAGKTTLLHLIDGLLFPTAGKCLIDGGPTRFRLPSVLSKVFYCGANMEIPAASIDELVKIHSCFFPKFSAEILNTNLADFGIDLWAKFSAMSMGMRQKASVAYALALQTPILLLDEPATGLDIESKQKLQHMMARCIDADSTVIVSTHNFSDLLPLYDSLMILDRGELLLSASIDEISERLAFITTDGPAPEDALFTLQRFGRNHSVIANPGDLETAIDYELLYLAIKNNHAIC